jgi:hypothetical protein
MRLMNLSFDGFDPSGVLAAVFALLSVLYVQQRQKISANRFSQGATVVYALFIGYVFAPFGFPNSEWSRAPLGTDVVRLIPGVNFDPALLETNWLPMQLLMGGVAYALCLAALYGDARRSNFVVIVILALGIEVSQSISNLVLGIIPPYRVDIHDILARSGGVLAVYIVASIIAGLYRWLWPIRWTPKMVPGRPESFLAFLDTLIRRI